MSYSLQRVGLVLGILIAWGIVLYYGSPLLQPLAFGALLAMLVEPLHRKLRAWRLPNALAIGLSLLAILLSFGLVLWLISWQISQLSNDWPQMQERLAAYWSTIQQWLQDRFGLTSAQFKQWLRNSGSAIGQRVMRQTFSFFSLILNLVLLIAYIALFLSLKEKFKLFFRRLLAPAGDKRSGDMLQEISQVARNYLGGRLMVIGILSAFYIAGFLLAGIKYAILLGLLTGLLSIIPYLGNVLGGGLAILLSLVSGGSPQSILIIVGVMTAGQLGENYLLVPKIVGKEVDLNAFAAIVCVVAFGLVWGISGAILAIPLTGIILVFFQHVDPKSSVVVLLGR